MEKNSEKKKYIYDGPVLSFGRCIGTVKIHTFAVSTKKALSNIAYTYKKQSGLVPATKIELCENYLVAE